MPSERSTPPRPLACAIRDSSAFATPATSTTPITTNAKAITHCVSAPPGQFAGIYGTTSPT